MLSSMVTIRTILNGIYKKYSVILFRSSGFGLWWKIRDKYQSKDFFFLFCKHFVKSSPWYSIATYSHYNCSGKSSPYVFLITLGWIWNELFDLFFFLLFMNEVYYVCSCAHYPCTIYQHLIVICTHLHKALSVCTYAVILCHIWFLFFI